MARKTKRTLAIFDIDGTIFRSSLLIELVNALVQEKVFAPSVAQSYAAAHRNWLDRKGNYDAYIAAVVKTFEKNLVGVRYRDYICVAERVTAFHHDRVYRYTRDLVKQLKKKNYYLLAISHSPKEVVDEFCTRLGFTKVYGRIYEVDGRNRFNGNVAFAELLKNKARVLKRVIEKEHLTLKGSVGVGDTEMDISFLNMVDCPVCFNPNAKLYRYARRKKWPVIVERKDVIYEL